MLDAKKLVKIVSVTVASMSLLGVSASVTEAASFTAPKLGVAEVAPTNPAIKKGDKIFVTIKDTKNQKVAVLNANGKKTAKTVSMVQLSPLKMLRRLMVKRLLRSVATNG